MESLLEQRERDRVLLREKATTPVLPWVKLRLLVSWMWRTSWGLGALLSSPASHKGLGPQSRLQWVWGLCPPHPWGAPHPSPWLPAHIPFPGPFTMGSVTSQRKKKNSTLYYIDWGVPPQNVYWAQGNDINGWSGQKQPFLSSGQLLPKEMWAQFFQKVQRSEN